MPPKKQRPAAKPAAGKKVVAKKAAAAQPAGTTAASVYDANKKLIDKVLGRCCRHLNGLPGMVVDEVLARLPAYAEKHRVTMTERTRKKAAARPSAKAKPDPLWGSV